MDPTRYGIRKREVLCAIPILFLYFICWSPYWRIRSDSAIYLKLTENLTEYGTYTFNCRPHTLYPPAYPFLLACYRKLGLGMVGLEANRLCVGDPDFSGTSRRGGKGGL